MFLYPLDPHQEIAVEYGLKNPYSILALEVGLGKTICALKIWDETKGNLLVVCPPHLILQWKSEIKKFLGDGPHVTVINKGELIYKVWDTDVVLISYDLALKAECIFEWADTVIFDEAHYLKEMEAKRTFTLHKYIYENSLKRVHLLTGTPIKNRVKEYYSLMALCNYNPAIKNSEFLKRFPNPIAFANYFSNRHQFQIEVGGRRRSIIKWTGIKNIPELKKYLTNIYIKQESDLIYNFNPRPHIIPISDIADEELLKEFNEHFKNKNEKGLSNSSTQSPAKKAAAIKKVPFTIQYAKSLLEEIDSVIIYSDHPDAADEIAKAFNTTAIHAKVTGNKRQDIVNKFQLGETTVLCATIGALSSGVNLQRSCNLILNDYSWVPGDLTQVLGRIVRRGQTRQCHYHMIVGSPQDGAILDEIREKERVIKLATKF